jgi:hypothetical protein
MNHLRPADFAIASVPAGASIVLKKIADLTLADWNNIAGIGGACLGACYLLWKWRREARRRPRGARD